MPNFAEAIKRNPMLASLSVVITFSAALTGVVNITGFWDRNHTSEEELIRMINEHTAHPHPTAKKMIEDANRRSQCSNIDVRIALLEDQIWRMKQDSPNSQRLRDKTRELTNLEERRVSLKCVEFDL